MLGACAFIAGAASMCCTADVSSVGVSESSVVSLLGDESVAAVAELFAVTCGTLSPAATVADFSELLEHAAATSVSKSDRQVAAPHARVFARSRKDILRVGRRVARSPCIFAVKPVILKRARMLRASGAGVPHAMLRPSSTMRFIYSTVDMYAAARPRARRTTLEND
jgi:hypothetical protein